jgi:hypothetical protein
LIWYGAGAIAAILVAWLAAIVHASGHAPIGLVSLGVGIALGATLSGLAAMQRIAGSRRLLLGTIVLSILTVLAQHAWLYVDFRRQWRESRAQSAAVTMFRPESPLSPAEYFAHEWTLQRGMFWCFDAVIIVSSAVGTVYVLRREKPPAPSP